MPGFTQFFCKIHCTSAKKLHQKKWKTFPMGKFLLSFVNFPFFFDKNMVYCYINTPVYAGKFSTQNVESVEKRKILKNPLATGFF